MRTHALLVPLLLALAGCIAPPAEDADAFTPAAAPPPAARIDGMTAEETRTDRDVDCTGGTLSTGACAERDILVVGRIGVDELPVDLKSFNGAIRIVGGAGDAWQFHAVIRVEAPTRDEARKGLDTEWAWTHENDGEHVLAAGPTRDALGVGIPLLAGSARLVAAKYEVVLPAWVLLDVHARTSNGAIDVTGVRADVIDVDTSNGAIDVIADAATVRAHTSNGAIDAAIRPTATGAIELGTSNGAIDLSLIEDARHGYDADATTSNGRVTILLQDGKADVERTRGTFRTTGYESRAIQTTVTLQTSNGAITIAA